MSWFTPSSAKELRQAYRTVVEKQVKTIFHKRALSDLIGSWSENQTNNIDQNNRQKALQGVLDGDEYPLSDEIHATTLSLPISVCHSEGDIAQVIDIMNSFRF